MSTLPPPPPPSPPNAAVTQSPPSSGRASLSQILSCFSPSDYFAFGVGVLASAANGGATPIVMIIMGQMLDSLNTGAQSLQEAVNASCIRYVIVGSCMIALSTIQVSTLTFVGERTSHRLRERYVKAILSQEIGWFDTVGASQLSTKVAENCGKMQDGFGIKVGDMLNAGFQFATGLGASFYTSWQLTVVLLSAFPLIGGAATVMMKAFTAAQNETAGQYALAGGLATESLAAIRTVTSLNAQPDSITRYRRFVLRAMYVGVEKSLRVGIGSGLLYLAIFLSNALGFWYGAKLIADQKDADCTEQCLSGGKVMTCFFCTIIGSMALGQVTPAIGAVITGFTAAHSAFEVIDRVPLIDGLSEKGTKPTSRPRGALELRDVVFAYPSRPMINVCSGYSLAIKPGESLAICGPSGSGKSTILNLILRFYDPQAGSVTLDGMDIRDLNVRWLRAQLGYVGQEPVLFSGTVADNIAYGLDRSVEGELDAATLQSRIESAARQANAHDFITEFPDGYNTDVGVQGSALSGGQKQRIAIARALIKRPSVLLLDEATSALDAASEKIVQASIDALSSSRNQTTIIIAHRLSTIRNCDRIAVVSGAKVTELGSHNELYEAGGVYKELVDMQMGSHDDSASSHLSLAAADKYDTSNTEEKDKGENKQLSPGKSFPAPDLQIPGNPSITAAASQEVGGPEKERKKLRSRMWSVVKPHFHWLIVGFFGSALSGITFPIWGLLLANTQTIFFYPDTTKMREDAALNSEYFVALGVASFVGLIVQNFCLAQVGERVTAIMRSDLFESLLRREIAYFDDTKNSVGALTVRLADDPRLIHEATGEAFAFQLQACCTLVVGLILGFTASWKVSLVVLGCFPVSVFAGALRSKRHVQGGSETSSDEGKGRKGRKNRAQGLRSTGQLPAAGGGPNGLIAAAFTHMRTIAAFSMHKDISEQYCKVTLEASAKRRAGSTLSGFLFGISQASSSFVNALTYYYGATLITKGEIDFQDLMTAMMSLMMSAIGLGNAMLGLGDAAEGLLAAKRIFSSIDDGVDSPIDGLSQVGLKPEGRARGRIELRNVNFRYPTRPDVEVCRDYSLTIEPGTTVAFVGPSGSGKSTIMNLLLRNYDVDGGEIMVDGVNVKDLNVRWLRAQFGYVGQEPALFVGSISENVAKGRADAVNVPLKTFDEVLREEKREDGLSCVGGARVTSDYHTREEVPIISSPSASGGVVDIELGTESAAATLSGVPDDVIEAMTKANAHDFVCAFTQGYSTDVGESSAMVSGGQKQRIAIARALIKRPAVLLLDEATSALDAASEKTVQASIDALHASKSQTTIIIAHRLTTIVNADKICVIDQGRVVETGTHDQLLMKKGLYSMLWARQQQTSK